MAFAFDDYFGRRSADWVDLSLSISNFQVVRRPLKVNIRLFQAQGWNRHPKEILSVDVTLKRRISSVRFENLPVGIPIYMHVTGDCVLADADEDGLVTGLEQFLGKRAQVRLLANAQQQESQRLAEALKKKQMQEQKKKKLQQQEQQAEKRKLAEQRKKAREEQLRRQRELWSAGPRRFQKMHSLASQQSLTALSEIDKELSGLEVRAKEHLDAFNRIMERQKLGEDAGSADLVSLRDALYNLDDEAEDLLSSKLNHISLQGVQSGMRTVSGKKKQLAARAQRLAHSLRSALVNPIFPSEDSEDEDSSSDAPDLQDVPPSKKPTPSLEAESTTRAAPAADAGGEKSPSATHSAEMSAADATALPKATVVDKTKHPLPEPTPEEPEDAEGEGTGTPEIVPPKKFGKQYSMVSQQRLIKLADIRERVDVIASEYNGMLELLKTLDPTTQEGKEAMLKVKNECAQLYGNLEKLQFREIDAVLVGDLTSGQTDARAARKQLTRDVSDLTDKVRETVADIKKAAS